MSKIDIKINHTKSVNKEIIHLSSKLAKTESSLSYIRHQLDSKLRQQRGIGHRLNEAVSSIDAAEKRIKRLYQFIDSSMELYIQAEKKVEQYKLGEVEQKTSWWEKIGKGVNTGKDIVKGFAKGIGTAVVSTVEGIWEAITHPVETVKGLVHVITHPVETAKGVWKSISDSWKKDVVNGDAESRSQWFGRGFGEVGLAVIGTKGVDKAAKLAKGTNVLNEVGGVRISSQNTDKKIKEDSNLNNNHIERKKVNNNEYSTQIDNRVFEIEKLPLPSVVSRTFKDSNYRTVVSKESITVYRAFGGYADAGGTFVTTTPTINRIQAKLDLALLPEWKNTRNYEAIIEVPKGTVLNIGRAEKQITITGSILKGNADQVLLPRDYPLEWIKEIKQIPSR